MMPRPFPTRTAALLAWTLAASSLTAQTRREIQFPDPPGWRTLKCDFHVHTVFSDGLVWPTVRVDEAWRQGLDAIAITDHVEYQPHKADVPTNFNRSFELAAARGRERNLLVIRGAEITRETPPGHFNALFLTDISPLKTDRLEDVFERAVGQGAFIFWNHPGWQGREKGQWGPVQQLAFERKQLHGIEIGNGETYYQEAHPWANERKLALIGTSDIHDPASDVPFSPEEHRTLTLVLARERSLESIREALFAGRTVVWWKNRLMGDERHLTALFGAAVQARPIHHQTKDDFFVEIENHSELNLELGRDDSAYGRPRVLKARAVTLLRLPHKRLDATKSHVTFQVQNLLTAPDRPLEVRLPIPPQPSSRPAVQK
ncbi:MAG: PHP domain-containing protein [Phycisphaerae bacterium]|jgi:hypothetical protein